MSKVTRVELLKQLYEGKEDITPSIPEMAEYTNKSIGHVHEELQELVEAGLVKPPPKPHVARAYRITAQGEEYLRTNGYIGAPKYITHKDLFGG